MLRNINNEYLISAETRALFREKLSYIQAIVQKTETEPDADTIEHDYY